MSPRRQILKLKLAATLGLNASFDADCDGLRGFQRIGKADRHAHRNAVKAFVEGVRTGDFELFWSGPELVEQHCVFKAAFRAVAKHSAPMEFRNRFSGVWQHSGDRIEVASRGARPREGKK